MESFPSPELRVISPIGGSLSAIGRIFVGVAAIAFGFFQLARRDFIRLVPDLPSWVPSPPAWAMLTGALLVVTGVSIALHARTRLAAGLLGAMLLLSLVFLHVSEIAVDPARGYRWTNPCKALALLGGTIVLAQLGSRTSRGSPSPRSGGAQLVGLVGPSVLLGLFLVLAGVQHFVYAEFVHQLVPAWLPLRPVWTYFTGLALVAGGVGIMLPRLARLAALCSGAMMFLWVPLLHLPRAVADLKQTGEMDGVFEALALSGVALLVAGQAPATKVAVIAQPSSGAVSDQIGQV